MKFTKSYLKQVIKEEIIKLKEEQLSLPFAPQASANANVKSTEVQKQEKEEEERKKQELINLQNQLDSLNKQLALFDPQTRIQIQQTNDRPNEKRALQARVKGLQDQIAAIGAPK
jgi:hypothetical protein